MKILFLLGIFSLSPALAADRGGIQNLDEIIENLNLRPYFRKNFERQRSIKVAIFDNGFRGAKETIGSSLPSFTQLHSGPIAIPADEETVHGTYMAKIFWSLLSLGGTSQKFAPAEFHLYNTFGYSNFKFAVNDAIRRKVDLILYSQTWEYGGNFDGKGFINTLVNKAADAGILWINNAGNFGITTFNRRFEEGRDQWLDLGGRNQGLEIRCENNSQGNCALRAVLSWNDFSDNVNEGTDKDLDFFLTDDTLNIIQGSSLVQKKDPKNVPGTSKYPREIISTSVKPGLYFLRVKRRSDNFDQNDKIRVVVSGDFVTMRDHDTKESILPPADNKRVITVGAGDSERSSSSQRMQKPELLTDSLVSLSRKENFKGSSNSAAMVAAGATILLSLDPALDREGLIELAGVSPVRPGQGLPLEFLGFLPSHPEGCFPVYQGETPFYVQEMVRQGGTPVSTNAGLKVFFDHDPISLLPGIQRRVFNDILVVSPMGPGIFHRSGLWNLPRELVEVLQTPRNQTICQRGPAGGPPWAKVFRLPGGP